MNRLVEFWDSEAPTYDRRSAWLERRAFAASRAWVWGRAACSVLDVACGTGANLRYAAPGVRVTGLDWSAAMLDVALRRAGELGRDVDLHRGDAADLPFADATFDAVVCTFALCSIDPLDQALAEMVRVVRPGGDLLLADHVVSTSGPVRLGQRAVEHWTRPHFNEHFTRRPLDTLQELPGVEIVETERLTFGAIERVHARRL